MRTTGKERENEGGGTSYLSVCVRAREGQYAHLGKGCYQLCARAFEACLEGKHDRGRHNTRTPYLIRGRGGGRGARRDCLCLCVSTRAFVHQPSLKTIAWRKTIIVWVCTGRSRYLQKGESKRKVPRIG